MTDRAHCLFIGCRRTFKRAPDDDGSAEHVCGKHWRLLPKHLRDEYKRLAKHRRHFERKWAKKGVENPEFPLLDRHQEQNWLDIRTFLLNPERPAGLDAFLEEIFG